MDFTKLKDNLMEKGYIVSAFETADDAKKYFKEQINGKSIAFGGSITVQDMGLYEELSENNKLFWHWKPNDGTTAADMLNEAKNAEIYISSANGVAETGEIINIDGTGNRVAAISYGHKKVYIIVGKNKVEADFEKALFRARNVAAPLNARRLSRNTPCTKGELKCHDCKSPERICRALSVLYTKPSGCEYEIILINEELGY